jgi:hypothetical protein
VDVDEMYDLKKMSTLASEILNDKSDSEKDLNLDKKPENNEMKDNESFIKPFISHALIKPIKKNLKFLKIDDMSFITISVEMKFLKWFKIFVKGLYEKVIINS